MGVIRQHHLVTRDFEYVPENEETDEDGIEYCTLIFQDIEIHFEDNGVNEATVGEISCMNLRTVGQLDNLLNYLYNIDK